MSRMIFHSNDRTNVISNQSSSSKQFEAAKRPCPKFWVSNIIDGFNDLVSMQNEYPKNTQLQLCYP